jgi:phosphate transport system ATP-binding protein
MTMETDTMNEVAPIEIAQPREAPRSASDREVVFETRRLTISYGKAPAVANVDLSIYRNLVAAIIGPSGCGKSTFLRSLNRMNDLVPSAKVDGEVLYHGQDIYGDGVDPVEVRRRIGMVFQKPNPFPKSIYDNVAWGLRVLGMKDELDGRVERALTQAALGTRSRTGSRRALSASPVGSNSASASHALSRWSRMSSCSTSPLRRSIRSQPRRSRT